MTGSITRKMGKPHVEEEFQGSEHGAGRLPHLLLTREEEAAIDLCPKPSIPHFCGGSQKVDH